MLLLTITWITYFHDSCPPNNKTDSANPIGIIKYCIYYNAIGIATVSPEPRGFAAMPLWARRLAGLPKNIFRFCK
jgi:hypothetical protein